MEQGIKRRKIENTNLGMDDITWMESNLRESPGSSITVEALYFTYSEEAAATGRTRTSQKQFGYLLGKYFKVSSKKVYNKVTKTLVYTHCGIELKPSNKTKKCIDNTDICRLVTDVISARPKWEYLINAEGQHKIKFETNVTMNDKVIDFICHLNENSWTLFMDQYEIDLNNLRISSSFTWTKENLITIMNITEKIKVCRGKPRGKFLHNLNKLTISKLKVGEEKCVNVVHCGICLRVNRFVNVSEHCVKCRQMKLYQPEVPLTIDDHIARDPNGVIDKLLPRASQELKVLIKNQCKNN
ncbi:unnamed protein product [Owenia fusiformis]|uniref:Uncharacterized protein n=1 Tax=Owenia fusiformis TaxID=6347 RepID=A0A8J1TUG6_OWEFU|nr:unnamed protein product [Owenia fusiformis]